MLHSIFVISKEVFFETVLNLMYAFIFLPFAHFFEGQTLFCAAWLVMGDRIAQLFVFFFKAILLFKTVEI